MHTGSHVYHDSVGAYGVQNCAVRKQASRLLYEVALLQKYANM